MPETLKEYDGLNKPDEKEVRTSVDAVQAVSSAFTIWKLFVARHIDEVLFPRKEINMLMLEEAIRIMTPLQDILPDVIDEPYFAPIETMGKYKRYGGLFYSGLLAVGKPRILRVTKKTPATDFWGYGLQQGVIDIDAAGTDHTGYFARGGLLINRGALWDFGTDAEGAYFINSGIVKERMGWYATGTFFNFGRVHYFGNYLSSGLFVTTNDEPQMGDGKDMKTVHSWHLKKDSLLDALVTKVQTACRRPATIAILDEIKSASQQLQLLI
ncbi:hypothetical protein HY639_03800 [Candidatus Woesearchaeota archaeon]|nr:hypothetical protein [Candidatus Woesearchaeota archaeon]